MCLTQESFAIAYVTAVGSRDVFHVLSRNCDHVSSQNFRHFVTDVVAASCSSERNVLYSRIFVKSVDVPKQCIVCFYSILRVER